MNNVYAFVRFQRKKLGITQEELAEKAGVGIRFVRELEQGKETLQLNKVEQVLSLFGFQLSPTKQHLDPYNIRLNNFNIAVKLTLHNKLTKYGIIINEVMDKKEGKINAWKFVPNNNAIKYHQNPDDKLTEIILHNDVKEIENQ